MFAETSMMTRRKGNNRKPTMRMLPTIPGRLRKIRRQSRCKHWCKHWQWHEQLNKSQAQKTHTQKRMRLDREKWMKVWQQVWEIKMMRGWRACIKSINLIWAVTFEMKFIFGRQDQNLIGFLWFGGVLHIYFKSFVVVDQTERWGSVSATHAHKNTQVFR